MITHFPLHAPPSWQLARLMPVWSADAFDLNAPRAFIEQMMLILRSVTPNTPANENVNPKVSGATSQGGHAPNRGPRSERADSERADGEPIPSPATDAAASKQAATTITMEQLVRDHADAVYRVALSVTRDPSLAEDASQDTLIKAWQSLPSYRGDAPLRHWILRIAHNTSISLLRKRREDVMSPIDMPERPSREPDVETQVQERLAIARFEAALQDLDGISRSVVVLREVEGLSYHEMSDVLQLPLPTIRTRLLRARRALANALDGWQP